MWLGNGDLKSSEMPFPAATLSVSIGIADIFVVGWSAIYSSEQVATEAPSALRTKGVAKASGRIVAPCITTRSSNNLAKPTLPRVVTFKRSHLSQYANPQHRKEVRLAVWGGSLRWNRMSSIVRLGAKRIS
jgi:hypothetical protein